ncbi:MAG: hypothetical protein AABO57_18855 [Acidobacteriota bacterium]
MIEVRTSPGVYLPGPAFKTLVTSSKPVTPRVPEFLQQSIEQTLLRNDPRLRAAQTAADTSIACTITDLSVSPGVETRTRQEYQQTGQTTVTDPETGATRIEPQYTYVDVPYRALVFEARMSVKCEVTDVATGILLYSDRFDAVYTDAREVGGGPSVPSLDDLNFVYLKLADTAAGLILAQLSPRVYSEIVALPSGKLKEASKLLESGLWSEALTLLSSMPAFKDLKDDAYRFYSIGVAHEVWRTFYSRGEIYRIKRRNNEHPTASGSVVECFVLSPDRQCGRKSRVVLPLVLSGRRSRDRQQSTGNPLVKTIRVHLSCNYLDV